MSWTRASAYLEGPPKRDRSPMGRRRCLRSLRRISRLCVVDLCSEDFAWSGKVYDKAELAGRDGLICVVPSMDGLSLLS